MLADGELLQIGPRNRATAGQQDAGHGVARLRCHPAAVEPDRIPVDLLPGPRSGHAGRRAGGVGTVLRRQADRNRAALVVDGAVAGTAAAHRVRSGVARGPAVSAGGHRRAHPVADHSRRGGVGRHAGPGERLPGSPHARRPRPHHAGRRGRLGGLHPAGRPRTAGATRWLPEPGRLHRRAPYADASVAAQRMGARNDHELADAGGRPAADCVVVDHRRRVRRDGRGAASPLVHPRVCPRAGRVGSPRLQRSLARTRHPRARRDAADATGIHPQGPAHLLPRQHAVESTGAARPCWCR